MDNKKKNWGHWNVDMQKNEAYSMDRKEKQMKEVPDQVKFENKGIDEGYKIQMFKLFRPYGKTWNNNDS